MQSLCDLPAEIDRYLLEFRGGTFPLSAIGSYKGSGGGGGRKGRDSSKLRRSNTSPRKKGSPALNWSCGGSFREGKMAISDTRCVPMKLCPSDHLKVMLNLLNLVIQGRLYW